MANKLYNDTSVKAIADAIRAKNGTTNTYNIGEMATAITNIPTGGNCYSVDITFPTRLKNGVILTLPSDVLAHKDDVNFLMTYQFQGDTLVNYRSYFASVGNKNVSYNSDHNKGTYCYSGIMGVCYYPINSTDNTFSIEGVYKVKFYIPADGKLYISEDLGASLDVGTYKFTFTW